MHGELLSCRASPWPWPDEPEVPLELGADEDLPGVRRQLGRGGEVDVHRVRVRHVETRPAATPAGLVFGAGGIAAIGLSPFPSPLATTWTLPLRSIASTRPETESWSIESRSEPEARPKLFGAIVIESAPPGPG